MREQGVDCRDAVNKKGTTLEKSYSAAPSLLELVLHLDATTSWPCPVDLLFSWYGVMSRRPPDAKKLRVSCFAKRQCCVLYCTLFFQGVNHLASCSRFWRNRRSPVPLQPASAVQARSPCHLPWLRLYRLSVKWPPPTATGVICLTLCAPNSSCFQRWLIRLIDLSHICHTSAEQSFYFGGIESVQWNMWLLDDEPRGRRCGRRLNRCFSGFIRNAGGL